MVADGKGVVTVLFDHSIVPAIDKVESSEFYSEIFGSENMGVQPDTPFTVVPTRITICC